MADRQGAASYGLGNSSAQGRIRQIALRQALMATVRVEGLGLTCRGLERCCHRVGPIISFERLPVRSRVRDVRWPGYLRWPVGREPFQRGVGQAGDNSSSLSKEFDFLRMTEDAQT